MSTFLISYYFLLLPFLLLLYSFLLDVLLHFHKQNSSFSNLFYSSSLFLLVSRFSSSYIFLLLLIIVYPRFPRPANSTIATDLWMDQLSKFQRWTRRRNWSRTQIFQVRIELGRILSLEWKKLILFKRS